MHCVEAQTERIFLKDVIDFDEMATKIAPHFPLCEVTHIKKAFIRFFWADQNSDFWYYDHSQIKEVLEEMEKEFILENLPIHVAQMCGLEVVEAQTWL